MCLCSLFCGLLPCNREDSRFRKRYRLGEELGRGSSGITRICTDRETGEKLACKTVRNSSLSDEAEIMKHLSGNPHIVELRSVHPACCETHIVMELCSGGSVFKNGRVLTKQEAARLIKCLMEAVQHCHSKGIVHRDITMKNVLIGEKPMDFKLADFGLSTRIPKNSHLTEIVGTLQYLAPEMLKRQYGKEVDVWSAGVVLYCVLSGYFPFHGNTARSTLHAIKSTTTIQFRQGHDSELVRDLISGMLKHDPKKRMTPEEVLNHEWVIRNTKENAHTRGIHEEDVYKHKKVQTRCVDEDVCKYEHAQSEEYSACEKKVEYTSSGQRCFSSRLDEYSYNEGLSVSQIVKDLLVFVKLLLGLFPR